MSENLLAGRIAQLRKEAGMTQEQLGNALGLTYQSVSKWGMEFPIVKDTTPNMTNPRLYIISHNKMQG